MADNKTSKNRVKTLVTLAHKLFVGGICVYTKVPSSHQKLNIGETSNPVVFTRTRSKESSSFTLAGKLGS